MHSVIVIWSVTGPLVQAAILVRMLQHRLVRKGMFPFFFAYNVYSILVTAVRQLLLTQPVQYRVFYWSSEVIYGVLALLCLNEVFNRLFRFDYEDHPWLRACLPLLVIGMWFGLFVWWRYVYQTPNGSHFGFLAAAFVSFVQGVHSIEGFVLALFILFEFLLDPGWNRYDYGVLIGFGFSGLITMIADAVRFKAGYGYQLWYQYAPATAYLFVALWWLYIFWPKREPKPKPPEQFLRVLERVRQNNEMLKTIEEWLRRQW